MFVFESFVVLVTEDGNSEWLIKFRYHFQIFSKHETWWRYCGQDTSGC